MENMTVVLGLKINGVQCNNLIENLEFCHWLPLKVFTLIPVDLSVKPTDKKKKSPVWNKL